MFNSQPLKPPCTNNINNYRESESLKNNSKHLIIPNINCNMLIQLLRPKIRNIITSLCEQRNCKFKISLLPNSTNIASIYENESYVWTRFNFLDYKEINTKYKSLFEILITDKAYTNLVLGILVKNNTLYLSILTIYETTLIRTDNTEDKLTTLITTNGTQDITQELAKALFNTISRNSVINYSLADKFTE